MSTSEFDVHGKPSSQIKYQVMINNATFFAGYNHLHHFHKANVLYHFYHNDEEYFERVLKPKYDDLQLASFYFPGEESYFKRTLVLEMRNTYLHAVETMFTLLEVLRVNHERLWKDPNAEDILFRILNHSTNPFYHNIRSYGASIQALDFIDKPLSQEWTMGRFLFYPALNPTEQERQDYLSRVEASLAAIKKGLHLMAKDFVQHEYNSFKHGMRVLDAFDYIAFKQEGSENITKVEFPMAFTYPRIVKEKGKPDRYDILTRPADFERDYRMCLLAARFLHLMTNNRRIAHTKESVPFPEKIPIQLFDDERIDWHAEEHVRASTEVMSPEEFKAWHSRRNQGGEAQKPNTSS